VSVVFAMGGGGFTMEPDNPALDDFVLSLSPAREPRVLFLPTASGDPASQIVAFHERYDSRPCRPAVLSLFRLQGSDRTLREIVLEADVLYIGGGSMRNLLAIWRAHDLDRLLREAYERGIVLAGLSAGAMCWFEGGVTRSSGPPAPIAGLGLLPGSLTVHADGAPERLPVWLEAVRSGALPGGWAADDGVGLLFTDGELTRVVSSRPGAMALRCDAVEGELVRRRIEPELLDSRPAGRRMTPDDVLEMRAVARMRHELGGSERLGDL
jgi:peptidase E